MQEAQIWSLGQEDPLKREIATLQYSCLENPMDKEPAGLQFMESQRVRHSLVTRQQQQQFIIATFELFSYFFAPSLFVLFCFQF